MLKKVQAVQGKPAARKPSNPAARARDAQRRMREAAELAQVGHWEWHVPSGALAWTEQTYRCFGFEPGEVVPSFELFVDRIHPEDRAQVQATVAKALADGNDYLAEFRYARKDGSRRIGRASGHVERDPGGAPLTMSGAMQDITSLRQSEQLFQVAFRASPLAASIARLDDGVFVEVNARYEAVFGWTRDEMIGHSALVLGLWPDPETRQRWIDELGKTGTVVNYEATLLNRDGQPRQTSFSAEIIRIDDVPHILAYAQDVTERKATEARIEYLAHHDPLTGLPNRVLFRDRFEVASARAAREGGKVALLFIDLDHFKSVNDTLGHPVGDDLLRVVAQRLREHLRDSDTVSRLGGDEFLIALPDIEDAEAAGQVARKIVQALRAPLRIDGHDLVLTSSIGIAMWPDDGEGFDLLLQRADTAMYEAKDAGRDMHRFFTPERGAEAMERLQLRSALVQALDKREFLLHYQPQIDLASRRVVGVEALLRWNRGGQDMIAPGRFITVAEEAGLIVPIGDWVLQEACAQAMRWQAQGLGARVVAVNLSAVQFRRGDLEGSVRHALASSGLDPALLELELTESLLLDDAEFVLGAMRRLKTLGLRLSIDDFGTGYSSLAYLKRFAVDKLKIDQSFVRDIVSDADNAAIVRAIISMAHSLKLEVIAEGVETEDAARWLQTHRCDEVQGYYYARPMPAEELAPWLAAWSAANP